MNEETVLNLMKSLNFALQQMGDIMDNLHGRIVELEKEIRNLQK